MITGAWALCGIQWMLLFSANDVVVDWRTIEGGGAQRSRGAEITISGTIGQADATGVLLVGGDLEMSGGFWFRVAPGDCNTDGGVGLFDFSDYHGCGGERGGPGSPAQGECICFDLDGDVDVDLGDFGVFQAAFDG